MERLWAWATAPASARMGGRRWPRLLRRPWAAPPRAHSRRPTPRRGPATPSATLLTPPRRPPRFACSFGPSCCPTTGRSLCCFHPLGRFFGRLTVEAVPLANAFPLTNRSESCGVGGCAPLGLMHRSRSPGQGVGGTGGVCVGARVAVGWTCNTGWRKAQCGGGGVPAGCAGATRGGTGGVFVASGVGKRGGQTTAAPGTPPAETTDTLWRVTPVARSASASAASPTRAASHPRRFIDISPRCRTARDAVGRRLANGRLTDGPIHWHVKAKRFPHFSVYSRPPLVNPRAGVRASAKKRRCKAS